MSWIYDGLKTQAAVDAFKDCDTAKGFEVIRRSQPRVADWLAQHLARKLVKPNPFSVENSRLDSDRCDEVEGIFHPSNLIARRQ